MILRQDLSRALSRANAEILARERKKAHAAQRQLASRLAEGSWPLLMLPAKTDDLSSIEAEAKRIMDRSSNLVILGMGASSRGGKTLCALAPASKLRLRFVDNIDPETMGGLTAELDWKSTSVLVISKSGATAETLALALLFLDLAGKYLSPDDIGTRFTALAEPGDNPLRRLAHARGMRVLDHDPNIGGRYAGLSAAGLLPAAAAGLDIRSIRAGAREPLAALRAETLSPPAEAAALHSALKESGRTVHVLMPYCDRLRDFTLWHQQLWAESLGKSGGGTTPVGAQGATDQHSQLQLFLDGPPDKFATLILLDPAGKGGTIPEVADRDLAYLSGHTLGDLFAAEQEATLETLAARGCPVRALRLPALDEAAMGALMTHFMLETLLTAQLWGIDPFGQPAVEESKRKTREALAAKR